jgi:uncharacterized protein YpmB
MIWFSALGLVMLILLLVRFYYGVQHEHWQEEADAARTATAKADLTKVDSVQTFNGESDYRVVTGTDASGEKVIVWITGDEAHVEKASAGIAPEQAKAELLKRSPGATLLRAVPGKLRDDYVWELFYKKAEPEGERYYYDYVKFADGSLIDTWRLSLQ